MKNWHDELESMINEIVTMKVVVTRFLIEKHRELGIGLSDEQIDDIGRQLESGQLENLHINLTDEQVAGSTLRADADGTAQLTLSDNDQPRFDAIGRELASEAVEFVLAEMSKATLDAIRAQFSDILEEGRTNRSQFDRRLREVWGLALDQLEVFISLSHDAGAGFNSEFREAASVGNDFVFEVLTRLHARACQVAGEVLVLLRNGFADGAHARWRTLHELSVVAAFISERGQAVAERYLCHNVIESYKIAVQYQENHAELHYDPMPDEELQSLREAREQMLRRFGSNFRHDHGWAAETLGIENPTFRDIEQHVRYDHMRLFYRIASNNVHAGPKGSLFRLGNFPSGPDILLSGASVAGLADPGQDTALSLARITISLLTHQSNVDTLTKSNVLYQLCLEVRDGFFNAHIALEDEAD